MKKEEYKNSYGEENDCFVKRDVKKEKKYNFIYCKLPYYFM